MESAEILLTGSSESEKGAELHKMKLLATALLILAFIIFIVASIFETRYPWVGFIRATAEAAMVGAIADWFAVTALFRHPLGLNIPHTAIIPRRKDAIGRNLGRFIKNNFLSPDLISERLRSMDVTRQLARWLSRPENSAAIAGYLMIGGAAAAQVMKDEEVQELIEHSVANRIRNVQVAPFLGSILAAVISGNRQRELLKGIIRLGAYLLEDNEASLKKKIAQEVPWWLPRSVTNAIYQRMIDTYSRTLHEVSTNPNHPLYDKFGELVQRFVDDLKHSPEVLAWEEAWKEELLQHGVIRDFSSSFWTQVKQSLLNGSEGDFDLARPIQQGLTRLAQAVLTDETMLHKVDRWIEDGARYLVQEYGYEVEQLISQTIEKWDAEATSRKIELQIGRDLQFIRINGTVVGGLVGLAIHTFAILMRG